jgi:hypothetical protein
VKENEEFAAADINLDFDNEDFPESEIKPLIVNKIKQCAEYLLEF